MAALRIILLEGDETGQELLGQAVRVLAPDVTGVEAELVTFEFTDEVLARARVKIDAWSSLGTST